MTTEGYDILTNVESARTKGMWAGALTRGEIPGLQGLFLVKNQPTSSDDTNQPPASEYELRPIPREQTPALLKIIDEGIVNASDHKKEHEGAKRAIDRVSTITIEFNVKTGHVVIANDGPGIPVAVHEGATAAARKRGENRDIYVPEVAFTIFLAGRNMKKEVANVKGGTNGIGAKLMTVHSTVFTVETVSGGQMYTQTYRNRLRDVDPPVIKKVPASVKPHTRVEFLPAYAELGYACDKATGLPSAQDLADIEAWCRWRAEFTAAYVGAKTRVLFNGAPCASTTAAALARRFVAGDPGAVVAGLAAKAAADPYKAHPWDVAVAFAPASRRFNATSVVNGVVTAKGPHILHVKRLLADAVAKKVNAAVRSKQKSITAAEATRGVFLVVVGAFPGADWGGQRKDTLQVPQANLTPYKISPAALGKVAEVVANHLIQNLERPTGSRKARVKVAKHDGARYYGTKRSALCSLCLMEGDSAAESVKEGLGLGAKNPGGPTRDFYGLYRLGGVTVNALKKVTVHTVGGVRTIVRSAMLVKNKVLAELVSILGLDFSKTYSTAAERATLNYGRAIFFTDQDLDGIGKIQPIGIVFFQLFWPALVAAGYVWVYESPVVRVYPKAGPSKAAPVAEFTHEPLFHKWVAENGGNGAVTKKYEVIYYKGLGRHDKKEIAFMFRDFDKNLRRITIEEAGARLMEDFYGVDTAPRKRHLSTPLEELSVADIKMMQDTRTKPLRLQMIHESKAYKLDDLQRKIPSVVDGMPMARRKILAAGLRRFGEKNRAMKVYQFGGYVANSMAYHHGEQALYNGITRMASRYLNGNLRPYFVGIGRFGNRHEGIKAAASARYIDIRLAVPYAKAMFPAADTPLLPYVFEDGERAQPLYFVPVLPAALLESFSIPSDGWKHVSYARDFGDVVRLVRAYAQNDPAVAAAVRAYEEGGPDASAGALAALRAKHPLRFSHQFYGDGLSDDEKKDLFRTHKGKLHSYGWYHGDEAKNLVTVTELPLGVTTRTFRKRLDTAKYEKLVDEHNCYSNDAGVKVEITLKPGAWKEICQKYGDETSDPFETFFGLHDSVSPYLNYYSPDHRIMTFDADYYRVFLEWAPLRRDLYRARLEREAEILRLKIIREREIIRYCEVAKELDLGGKRDVELAEAALAARKFRRLNSRLIDAPGYVGPADLRRLALDEPDLARYDYLLNLPQRELVAAARARREAKVKKHAARVAAIEDTLATEQPFPGAAAWLAEVDAVVKASELGAQTDWTFEK